MTEKRASNSATDMKTISIGVSEQDYEAFQIASRREKRPVAQLIREAMAFYRQERLETRRPLRDLPVLPGHRPTGALPSRAEVWEEIFDAPSEESR